MPLCINESGNENGNLMAKPFPLLMPLHVHNHGESGVIGKNVCLTVWYYIVMAT